MKVNNWILMICKFKLNFKLINNAKITTWQMILTLFAKKNKN